MTCCSHCQDAEDVFSARTARRDLRRYRRKGPSGTTRMLLEAIRARFSRDWTVLDVGGGVGAIQHELVAAGAARAIQVDASGAYLEVAREEAARRGHADRVEQVHGDFVEVAGAVPEADVVTLDRVICCYPAMERLVEASAAKARHVYGLVYPRDRWPVRAFLALENFGRRLRRNAFRTYVHPPAAVHNLLLRLGFVPATSEQTLVWHVATWVRSG